MTRSLIAFAIAAVLAVLSMGALGGALYYAAYPLLAPAYGNPSLWEGDWVWPAMITSGVIWSFGFLIAGAIHQKLVRSGKPRTLRRAIYLATLWAAIPIAWVLTRAIVI